MGVYSGPNIERDGLVLCLDKYDEISYPGEPTTNLISDGRWESAAAWNSPGWSGWGNSGMMTLATTDLPNSPEHGAYGGTGPVVQFGPSGWGSGVSGISYNLNYTATTEATVSFWWRITNTGSGNLWSGFYQNPGLDSRDLNPSVGSTTDWAFYSVTRTWTNSSTHYYRFITDSNSHDGTDFTMQVWGIQFEVNSHVTKFVNGTRASGSGWKDLSGNGNHADLKSLTYSTTNIVSTPNNDFDFDGSSDYITFGATNLPSGNADVSLSIWCLPTVSEDSGLFGYGSSTSDTVFEIYLYNDSGTLKPAVHYAGGNGGTNLGLNLNEWNYIVATYDKTSSRIYVNGKLSVTDAQALTIATTYRHIGTQNYSAPAGEYFDGKISSAQIYNITLSAKQVLENFNAQRGRFAKYGL